MNFQLGHGFYGRILTVAGNNKTQPVLGVGAMVLIFGGISRYCTSGFFFKDYNRNTDFRQKKEVFKCFWWVAPQKFGDGTFLENSSKYR